MSTLRDELKPTFQKIAAKLLSHGLTPSGYTKEKAKKICSDVAAPVYVRKMIDSFSPEIKKEMAEMKRK